VEEVEVDTIPAIDEPVGINSERAEVILHVTNERRERKASNESDWLRSEHFPVYRCFDHVVAFRKDPTSLRRVESARTTSSLFIRRMFA
jgi:hypothetical protein